MCMNKITTFSDKTNAIFPLLHFTLAKGGCHRSDGQLCTILCM